MIKSLPMVDDSGVEYGNEVSFKYKELTAIEKMHKWSYRRTEGGEREEFRELIDGCCTINLGRNEFNVKGDYNELLAQWKEHYEMYG